MRNESDTQLQSKYSTESDQTSFSSYVKNGSAKSIHPFSLNQIRQFSKQFENSSPDDILSWGYEKFGGDIVLGTGFGPSGVFLIHRLISNQIPVKIFYLDTHLLFRETYWLRDELEKRFDIKIDRVTTDLSLEGQKEKYGDELWKSDPDKCCYIRKVLPLKNYLSDKKAWVTGVRRNQAASRKQTDVVEWDPLNEVVKINPLAGWSNEEVWDYIHEQDLPYNPLHDDGFPTIGCIPCTEPADSEEDERSGRWKKLEKTECGIHLPTQNFQNGNNSSK